MATTAVQTTAAAAVPAATTRQATSARAAAGFGGDFNTFLRLVSCTTTTSRTGKPARNAPTILECRRE